MKKESKLNKGDQYIFKIVNFFSRFTGNLSNKLRNANNQLNFIKYQMLFGERSKDIYITTFPKSGTTLMQMMLYQLTTDGNMDFNHIYEKSPWIKNDAFKRIEPRELPDPRIIKTHDNYKEFDAETQGRFIHVIRNGLDVAVSLYHQNKNYRNPNLTFENHIKFFNQATEVNWFDHSKDWLENKNNLNILYLKYEEILDDMEGTIQKVAKFCKIELDEERMNRTKERCSFSFMKEFEDKFGEQPTERTLVYDQFIRKGKKGEGESYFNPDQKAAFTLRYNKSGLNQFI